MGGQGSGRKKGMDKMFDVGTPTQFTEGEKSKGILDDFAERQNVDTREGTIQKVPVNAKDIVNKAYADGLGGGGVGGLWTSGANWLYPIDQSKFISGAGLYTDGAVSGANVTSGQNPGHTHTFDNITNPEASKTFNFGNNKSLTFTSVDNTPIAGEGTFNFEASGNFTGDLVHIHQHTGNAGVGTVGLHIETEDADILPLRLSGARTYDIETDKGIWSETTISGATIVGANVTSGVNPGHTHDAYAISGAILVETDPIWTAQSGAFLNDGSLYSVSGAVLAEVDPIWNAQSGAFLNDGSLYSVSGALLDGGLYAASGAATITFGAHVSDSSDPHGADTTQTASTITTLSGANIVNTGDHNTSGAAFVVGIITHTSATPPTASGFPQGTIYLQYTA